MECLYLTMFANIVRNLDVNVIYLVPDITILPTFPPHPSPQINPTHLRSIHGCICMRERKKEGERMKGFSARYRVIVLLLFLFHIIDEARGQAASGPAAAPAPGPPPPLNVTAVLEKGGQFRTLIRLLQSTQIDKRIEGQLNSSNAGMTLFAPSDNAFSSLSPGTLNTLTNQQQVTLLEYHVIPTLITLSQFQTVSNPISTQAGDSSPGQYPLNVTTAGNQVNISTGLINTTISGTVYSDSQLAVYQVDKVLLPLGIFRPSVQAPPPKAGKNASDTSEGPSNDSNDSSDASSTIRRPWRLGIPFAVAVSILYCSF
ncbi:fasciclin-like arabinogalactan protein 11 [Phalaenopsis equestris]|uniref:fasciclin-like arabinogalactan protein 11 n=1 Tax=Phalaenopsis equestris TaxID=78828 RepID=UPI0009E3B68F|nr:fasciclin-like arabinogalactan protein 11 [Phalaenopsis equestris]